MFTGIIEATGTVARVDTTPEGCRIAIEAPFDEAYQMGESIAVDGCCLTVVAFDGGVFEAEASKETLDVTTLGSRRVGQRVNLEKAMRMGDRLGGHIVSGHVDGTGALHAVEAVGDCFRTVFSAPKDLLRYLIPKGSVTVDGISLTVNAFDDEAGTFEVMIVPHTRANTSLGDREPGDGVNLEVDLLGKYVERLFQGA